jgi:hypothetical protein
MVPKICWAIGRAGERDHAVRVLDAEEHRSECRRTAAADPA